MICTCPSFHSLSLTCLHQRESYKTSWHKNSTKLLERLLSFPSKMADNRWNTLYYISSLMNYKSAILLVDHSSFAIFLHKLTTRIQQWEVTQYIKLNQYMKKIFIIAFILIIFGLHRFQIYITDLMLLISPLKYVSYESTKFASHLKLNSDHIQFAKYKQNIYRIPRRNY